MNILKILVYSIINTILLYHPPPLPNSEQAQMPYIKRNLDGSINSLSLSVSEEHTEYIAATAHELIDFLSFNNETELSKHALAESDRDIARVTEDLIHLLISKNVILFTELPPAVQQKILGREKLRSSITGVIDNFLIDDDSL